LIRVTAQTSLGNTTGLGGWLLGFMSRDKDHMLIQMWVKSL